ncbi:methyl-accepting chemotaxis protein [Aquabacter sp. CN5-332]|uniref:methyl-accepting chemotaxis protein n=1 Tax=Aquabacter sp. CN5-332 TaxID=3156608 RepID=UPI0032B3E897
MQVFASLARLSERISVERGDLNQALLSSTTQISSEAKANMGRTDESVASTQAALAALAPADKAAIETPLTKILASARTARALVESEVAKPANGRDPQAQARYVSDVTANLGNISRLSDDLELRINDKDGEIGSLAGMARYSLMLRDIGGRRSTMLTSYLGNRTTLTPAQIQQFYSYTGQITTLWSLVQHAAHDLDDVPGITAAVEKADKEFMQVLGKLILDTFQEAVAGRDTQVSIEAWRNTVRPALVAALAPRDAALAGAEQLADTKISNARIAFIGASAACLLILVLVVGFGTLITRRVIEPIRQMSEGIEKIAAGVFDVTIPGTERRDEIGEIGRAVEILRNNSMEMVRLQHDQVELREQAEADRRKAFQEVAEELDRAVGRIAGAVSTTSEELQASARAMAGMAESTSSRSDQASQAAQIASTMVETVAAAAEELSASVEEIGARVTESTRITGTAVQEANDAASKISALLDAARRIGDILSLITNIAGQTNLLALNATIEAARAGEAGRGFAVVASEVKSLADQTTKATAEIEAQISTVQHATDNAAKSIADIAKTIGAISHISTTIASAVTQQAAATQEIAHSISRASDGARNANSNIEQVALTAVETGSAATQVLEASSELSRTSADLRQATDSFVLRIRAA